MKLRRAKVELEYDEKTIMCNHHPDEQIEPTLIVMNGHEYTGHLSVEFEKDTYVVRFTRI